MTKKRMVVQFGMGSSIRSRNYTQAAIRGVRDALWHNALNVADAFGFPKQSMLIDVVVGVQHPEAVDAQALIKEFPYGQPTIKVQHGGLDIPKPDGKGLTVIANVAVVVSFDSEFCHD